MLISGRTWSQLFLCAVACAAQIRAFQSTAHTSAAPPAKNAPVLGRVIEAGTNTPVSNATVAIQTSSGDHLDPIRTTADGSFSFLRVPDGPWTVEIVKAGYKQLVRRSFEVASPLRDGGLIVALTKLTKN